jgi:Tol biopolymer transport system component
VADDNNDETDIFVKDTVSGEIERISIDQVGAEANQSSATPDISADGRFVVFQSAASNLVEGDEPFDWDIFIKDRETGDIVCVSKNSEGEFGNVSSYYPKISANGGFVVFESRSTNLVANDLYNIVDIFRVTNPLSQVDEGNTNDAPISAFFPAILEILLGD